MKLKKILFFFWKALTMCARVVYVFIIFPVSLHFHNPMAVQYWLVIIYRFVYEHDLIWLNK